MTEFPSDGEPSMVQAADLRRLRRKMYTMPKIRSTATPEIVPSGMARLYLWPVPDSSVGTGVREALDEEEVLKKGQRCGVRCRR